MTPPLSREVHDAGLNHAAHFLVHLKHQVKYGTRLGSSTIFGNHNSAKEPRKMGEDETAMSREGRMIGDARYEDDMVVR